ncbi:ligase-associated DNA damage response endonuclease PdeM [Glaciecola sp. MH2013]|uniref:ligase-associated DNA damage response endonuclease PdeM n=1 Tax=Glaciecola sp. MH2013 TaxID=2785524 RepID=UPI00189E4B3D|nr:ligase-associated DNA damage response endonuclease PdeM [Glaciecola sp. MH2013]MBF7074092.1 ligase-associated DNA damage response endonuclease PdeM [Glaciecola sp. MH2013]
MISETDLLKKIQNNKAVTSSFSGHQFVLDAAGCLYWPKHDLLVFSDLHFEKGSFLSQFANPLPRYDTAKTLAKMSLAIDEYSPQKVLCLGDSLHDSNAVKRMLEDDRDAINSLVSQVPEWFWVLGNHDPEIPKEIHGTTLPHIKLDKLLWVHEPEDLTLHIDVNAQVIGHFHPKIMVKRSGQRMTGKCFLIANNTFLMPALGQYTGGLSVNHEAITSLYQGQAEHAILFNNKVFLV